MVEVVGVKRRTYVAEVGQWKKALPIAHYALHIVSQGGPASHLCLPVNLQCVMRNGQCFLPRSDQKKADEYFAKVNEKVANLISEVIRKWDLAGL